MEQRFDLRVRELRAAAVGVDRELRVVEAQLLGAHGVEPAAKAQDLLRGQEAVAACDDQVNVFGQAVR